jgi:hypothetical protein
MTEKPRYWRIPAAITTMVGIGIMIYSLTLERPQAPVAESELEARVQQQVERHNSKEFYGGLGFVLFSVGAASYLLYRDFGRKGQISPQSEVSDN